MMKMTLRDYATEQVIKNLVKILPRCSDKTFSRGAYLLEKVATEKHKDFIRRIKGFMGDGGSARDFVKRLLKETNPHCREKFAVNLIANGLVINSRKREDAYEAGSAVPTTILISPTMRCNLKCKGCYAFNYSKKDDLGLDVIDRVIQEAKESGAAFFTILGGEPFVKKELLDIFKNLGLVDFDKHGRIKFVKLTPDGIDLANDFESVLRKFSKLRSRKK